VVHTKLTIPATVVRSYRLANIKVCISVHWEKRHRRGKIIAMRSYGAVVDGQVPRLVRRLSWSGVAGLALDWSYADF
jgi:hypothetical protein